MRLNIRIILATISVAISFQGIAQVSNRLPRKTIINAMQNALQDTTVSHIKPFVCKQNTTAITIQVSNATVPEERPYLITVDSLGVMLEIFRGEEHVFSEFYQYHGCNFDKIKAKVQAAKLKKVKPYGETLCGGNTTKLSFHNENGVYFELSDDSGLMNYDGDFDGVITEITGQIPHFKAIICKEYSPSSTFYLNPKEVKVENEVFVFTDMVCKAGYLIPDMQTNKTITIIGSNPLTVEWLESDQVELKLLKLKECREKKKSDIFLGITYEDIVRFSIPAISVNNNYGTIVKAFNNEVLTNGMYVLYNAATNKAIVFELQYEISDK